MYKIEEVDGRTYFCDYIKKKGKTIDCSEFFKHLEEYNNKLCKEQGVERLDRHHPTQGLLNKFSGQYVSPSMIKGYMTNPAACFMQQVTPKTTNDITEIGRTVHKCLERFYNLSKEERDLSKLDEFLDEEIGKFEQEKSRDILKKYIEGYKNTMDYLDETKEFDSKNLDCYCEYFIKCELNPFGVELPLPVYCVADRIDIRGSDIFVTDYKTGTYLRDPKFLVSLDDGYLGSMIMYKWAVEKDLGMPVKRGFLYTPGLEKKIWELDFSLENQSKYLEKVILFCEKFKREAKTHIYEYIEGKGYFSTQSMKEFRDMMAQPGDFDIPIRYDITPIADEEEEEN